MVAVGGNAGGKGAAEDLRGVEGGMARIGPSDEDAADGVLRPVEEAALTILEVARVGFEHRRKNGAHHEILDGAVGDRRAVALAVAFGALTVSWLAVFCLADACDHCPIAELNWIESAARNELVFLPWSKRYDGAIGADARIVGHCEKQAVVRAA